MPDAASDHQYVDDAHDLAKEQIERNLREMREEDALRGGTRDGLSDFSVAWALAHPSESVMNSIQVTTDAHGQEAAVGLLTAIMGAIAESVGQAGLALQYKVTDVRNN